MTKNYFTKFEITLWTSSMLLTIISFVLFDRINYFSFFASLLGITALIFCAKGNPIGQGLMIIFGLMYGIISYSFAYYGEMLTYVGMTVPMAIVSLISWIRNPYKGNKAEVEIYRVTRKDIVVMSVLTVIVTVAFYYILKYFNTTNLIPSTVSVTTSFVAVFLTFKRSPYYALAYALNDIVLIVLWLMAAAVDTSYISVIICFSIFLINDIYGFYNWQRILIRQRT